MRLLYLDESGSTGLDLDNKQQPFFVLSGISIEDDKWHKINDYFEKEKIKISQYIDSELNKFMFNKGSNSYKYLSDTIYLVLLEKRRNFELENLPRPHARRLP